MSFKFSLTFTLYCAKLLFVKVNEKLESQEIDFLILGLQSLKSRNEYYGFFEDLLTVAELKSLGNRFKAAKLLSEGKTYNEVAEKTGASSATISRINKALSYGAGGYNTVLARLGEDE